MYINPLKRFVDIFLLNEETKGQITPRADKNEIKKKINILKKLYYVKVIFGMPD